MKKNQLVILVAFLFLTARAQAFDLGGVVKKATGGSTTTTTQSGSTTTPVKNGVMINNSDNAEKFKYDFKNFLKASFSYNTFYDCFQSPYSAMLASSEGHYGQSTHKDAFTSQWLFKTGGRDGRDSCTMAELDDDVGKHSSGAQGVKLNFTSGWCDFLADRFKLSVQ